MAACVPRAHTSDSDWYRCMRLLVLGLVMMLSSRSEAHRHGDAHLAARSPSRPSPKPALNHKAIRRAVLCTLAVQNAAQMLAMRYSRMPGQPQYLTRTAVVMAEVVKILASFAMLLREYGPRALGLVWDSVIVDWRDTLLVGVPALLYLVQNNLLYVATTHLDAATCQVAYQLKLLTTAFFTVTLLKRAIPLRRWLALFVLFLGVVLVQTPGGRAAAADAGVQSALLGTAAVTGACFLSGLSGVVSPAQRRCGRLRRRRAIRPQLAARLMTHRGGGGGHGLLVGCPAPSRVG